MKFNVQIQYNVPPVLERLSVAAVLKYRLYQYGCAFRKIELTQGKYAIVDPEDYEELNKYKWFAKKTKHTYYAARMENRKRVYMHRQIMRPGEGLVVDHKNHKGFDNRKTNLQIVTIQENNWNSRKMTKTCSSQYKGVSRRKDTNKWQAAIHHNGKDIHLGYFDDEIEAAKTYDAAAKKYRGRFAVLNFEETANKKTPACGRG